MTNSMIPYSFVPGTKAKASEVNANFISLANVITQNQMTSSNLIQALQEQAEQMSETLAEKADKSELQTNFTVDETDTNLDDYLTPGTYIFDSAHAPTNPPVGTSGMLIVTGTETKIKQMWYSDIANTAVRVRNYTNSEWGSWASEAGISVLTNSGYLKMPNGLIIQWGYAKGGSNNYPIAFPSLACVIVTKSGAAGAYERSDCGLTWQSLTGFTFTSYGSMSNLNWIAIGY